VSGAVKRRLIATLRQERSRLKPGLFAFEMCSSVVVDVPVQRAWEVVADASRWPAWSEVCTAVWGSPESSDDWEVGKKFGFRLRMAKRNVPFNVTVIRIEPTHLTERLIEWTSTKFTISAVRTISVSAESEHGPEGCRVTDRKLFSSPFLPIGLVYPTGLIRRMTESWLYDLKQEAESCS